MSKDKPTRGGRPKKNTEVSLVRSSAAEVIVERADHERENMGLISWEGAPKGKIHRYDVSIAKNYLDSEELDTRNNLVGNT